MQDAREHILDTALQLFLQNSYKEVTMNALVKASGLSKGAFYHYFDSKEQLFETVIGHFYGGQMHADYSSYSHESLDAFSRDYLRGAAQRISHHPTLATGEGALRASGYLLLLDALKRLPAFRALLKQQQEIELAEWSTVVRQARATGEIRTDLEDAQVAKLFIFLADGIAINHMLHEQTDELLRETMAGFEALYQQLRA